MKTAVNQFIATAIVNLLALAHGLNLGWSSPAIKYLKSPQSHLNGGSISTSEGSWIGSAVSIGAFVMTILAGFLSDYIGKKRTLMLLAFPNLIFWVMIYLCYHAYEIIIARTIAGMTGGGIFRILGLYTADISENHLRGGLSSIFPLTMYGGMLIMLILATYLDYFVLPLIGLVFPSLGFLLMFFLPETPHFLIEKKKYDEAFKSLKFYRSCNSKTDNETVMNVEREFDSLKSGILNATTNKIEWADFTTKKAKIGISIGVLLVFLLTFGGNSVLMIYTAPIFDLVGSSLPSNESAMIVGAMQILGILFMGTLVDHVGRKILMIMSCTGSTLSLMLMAIFLLVKENGTDVSSMNWAPLCLMCLAIFFQSLGISSLPFIMIGELVPFKIREICTLICMLVVAVFMFITLKIFPNTVEAVGMSAVFWFFAIVCFIGLIVSIFFMPETKGKSAFDEE